MNPVSILWIGIGMGEPAQNLPWWSRTWEYLINHRDFKISHLKLIDIIDEPLPFFSDKWTQKHGVIQETARQDFFSVTETNWNIIILDFIEAWMLGKRYWPNLATTPFFLIRDRWEQKLQQLSPKEVWVVHDAVPDSTIIPDLDPSYQVIVDTKNRINFSEVWDAEALEQFNFWKYLTIWRRIANK